MEEGGFECAEERELKVNSYRKSEVMLHSATCPRLALEEGSLAFLASVLLVLCKFSASFLLYYFFTSFLQVRCRCSELCLACGALGEYRTRIECKKQPIPSTQYIYMYIYEYIYIYIYNKHTYNIYCTA
jgi:hypothetical protein